MKDNSLIRFAKILSGSFTNKDQSEKDPINFAHINIFFRPLPWEFFNAPGLYSEQSYDYNPWSPYRQAIHRLSKDNNIYIVENFEPSNSERIAGAGKYPELLKDIESKNYKPRTGCNMHFKEIIKGEYHGLIEPGKSCIIERQGKTTYLQSEVKVNQESWTSEDKGLDASTNLRIWGAENGPLIFKRVEEELNMQELFFKKSN